MIDNYDLFEQHEREVAMRLARLPKCNNCGEPITSDYAYDVDGLWCEDCFEEYRKEIRVDVDMLGDEE